MERKHYAAIFFVAFLLIGNLMAVKIIQLGAFTLPAAVILYPFCFMLGDVITELGGFSFARKIIITGFAANLLMALFLWLGQIMPPSPAWHKQYAYEIIFSPVFRVVLASLTAYLAGEIINSYIMVKIKEKAAASPLYVRTVLSSVVGQFFDTIIFIAIAFGGTMPGAALIAMIAAQYIFKIIIEAVLGTPLAYLLIKLR
jgi:uncharacterized integral membrane protein (TIGR00697 family)